MAVNPRRRRRRTTTRRRTRRNPRRRSSGGLASFRGISPKDVVWATTGMIATQTLTPMVLSTVGQPSTGPIGMAGKLATALLGAFAVSSVVKSKSGAQSFLMGGLISLGSDIWNTYVKPRLGLGGYYEFGPAAGSPNGMGAYMFEPMNTLLGVDGCVPSDRYVNPTDQVVVGANGGMPSPGMPVMFPPRLTPPF